MDSGKRESEIIILNAGKAQKDIKKNIKKEYKQ